MYLGAYRWDVTLGTAYVERKLELQKALFTTIPVPYVPTYNSDSIHVNAGRCVRYLVLLYWKAFTRQPGTLNLLFQSKQQGTIGKL